MTNRMTTGTEFENDVHDWLTDNGINSRLNRQFLPEDLHQALIDSHHYPTARHWPDGITWNGPTYYWWDAKKPLTATPNISIETRAIDVYGQLESINEHVVLVFDTGWQTALDVLEHSYNQPTKTTHNGTGSGTPFFLYPRSRIQPRHTLIELLKGSQP